MSVHLVIGMGLQNCYFHEQGTLYTADGMFTTQMLDKSRQYLSSLRGNFRVCLPFLVRRSDDSYYQNDQSYCMVGSMDTAVVVQFAANRTYEYIQVSRPNLLSSPAFKTYLQHLVIDKITMFGAESHSGVLLSAASLRDLGHSVTVRSDLVSSRDTYLNDAALSLMSVSAGVEVV